MKKSDWALIIIIVGVVAVASWFIIGSILPQPSDETVKTAPSIISAVESPENNVILYDADRPSWCPKTNSAPVEEDGENGNPEGEKNPDNNTAGRQYINSVFNSCAINSSFTTTTE